MPRAPAGPHRGRTTVPRPFQETGAGVAWTWHPGPRAGLMAGQAAATAATRAALAALDAAAEPGAWPAMETGGERAAALTALDRPGA
eukprot:COSAG04_NODE_3396_length_2856_cov_4.706202_2_plen_86_part_01